MAKPFKPSMSLKKYAAEHGTKVVDGETVPLDEAEIKTNYDEFVAKEKEEYEDAQNESARDDSEDEEDEGEFNNKKAVADMSFPPLPKDDKATKVLRGKWRDQKRIKCAQPKCCYPLNVIQIKGVKQELKVPEDHEAAGEVAYKAECSWDPRHPRPEDGSEQYVTHKQLFPPEDEADEDL